MLWSALGNTQTSQENLQLENREENSQTCKTIFFYKLVTNVVIHATMLRDKLKENVARITEPLFKCDAVKGNITFNKVNFWPKIPIMYKQQLVSLEIERWWG